jgi:hypothetical protein
LYSFSLVTEVYFFYTFWMVPKLPSQPPPDSLSLKVGSWFEAHATGKGVIAIPVVVLLLAIAAGLKYLLSA